MWCTGMKHDVMISRGHCAPICLFLAAGRSSAPIAYVRWRGRRFSQTAASRVADLSGG